MCLFTEHNELMLFLHTHHNIQTTFVSAPSWGRRGEDKGVSSASQQAQLQAKRVNAAIPGRPKGKPVLERAREPLRKPTCKS